MSMSPRKGCPGLMIVTLKMKPHPRFVRQGDHLVCAHEVSLYEALTGARRSDAHWPLRATLRR